MNRLPPTFALRRFEKGLTLVEMMVALALGLVLMLGVVQIFAASRTASVLAEGGARAQENARFALEFLQRDIRMAGHFGCVNDQAHFVRNEGDPVVNTGAASGSQHPLDFSVSLQGYEAPNTAPGGAGLTLGGTWALPANLPKAIADLGPRGGSDVLVLRYLSPDGVPVTGLTAGSDSVLAFTSSKGARLTDGGVSTPTLFGIADCSHANVFKGKLEAGKVTALGANLGTYATQPAGQTMLYRAESVVYYVGTSATTGEPVLMRARSNGGDAYSAGEELVEGIESLQFMYGLDSTDVIALATPPSGNITTQAVATGVAAPGAANAPAQWRRVGQVQVAVLARSPMPAAAPKPSDTVANPRALGVEFKYGSTVDGRYRIVYESTVALRNRLFGN
ncbi:PilW family protein [Stenotrophomonas sp.]|uniref:PilW family protein n=1 Tax=Stenotrophomonas sp. TaxID=69392 RepID=UPI0028B249DA|nr:PilW family protein [Stenotrophomonas sp.]